MATPAQERVFAARDRLHLARERAAQTGYRPDTKRAVAEAERELDAALAAGEHAQHAAEERIGRLMRSDRDVREREVKARRKAAADTRDANERERAERPESSAARLARTPGYDPDAEFPVGQPF